MTSNAKSSAGAGLLRRILRDQAGNTIALVAAALIPLTAMIGSSVDLSRAYMVKSRLQQACDAGVLAGRKAVGDGAFDANAIARAEALFSANFPDDYQGGIGTEFTPSSDDGGTTVEGTASTTLPTVIMGLFADDVSERRTRIRARMGAEALDIQSMDLTVTCSARLEVGNADIVFALDTTGSMTQNVSNGSGGTTTRIEALQEATRNFNQTMEDAAEDSTARIRYGFVPFSGTVNTGHLLIEENPAYILGGQPNEFFSYQSRRPVYRYPTGTTTSSYNETLDWLRNGTTYAAYTPQARCTNNSSRFPANNNSGVAVKYYRSGSWRDDTWYPSTDNYSDGEPATNSGFSGSTFTFDYVSWTAYGTFSGVVHGTCVRRVNRTQTTYDYTYDGTVAGATFSYYEYDNISWPVSAYVASGLSGGSAITNPFKNRFNSPGTVTWEGCIQERSTVQSDDVAYDQVNKVITPSGALDLDLDSIPTTNSETKWRPYWPESSYYRDDQNVWTTTTDPTTSKKSQTACPARAQLLAEMTSEEFDDYIDGLNPTGGTYHDIGAIWGARLISPDGIFADNVNEPAGNGGFVGKHLIYMTDGQFDAGETYHSAYGVERNDHRITDDGSTNQDARHIKRFRAVCDAIKAKGVRVWVIAFATSLNSDMIYCASADSSFVSIDSATLNQTFVNIAQSIADLRLSQ